MKNGFVLLRSLPANRPSDYAFANVKARDSASIDELLKDMRSEQEPITYDVVLRIDPRELEQIELAANELGVSTHELISTSLEMQAFAAVKLYLQKQREDGLHTED